jgi:hypothetical protein
VRGGHCLGAEQQAAEEVRIAVGSLKLQIGKTFHPDEIVEAHRTTEENTAGGKVVVLT